MFEERWVPIAVGAGIFVFLFALLPPAKIPLWVVNLTGASAVDASDARGGIELAFVVHYDVEADPDEAVLQVVEVVRRRIDARGLSGASVHREDDRVIVRLADVTGEQANRLREMLSSTGNLEFRVVEHGSALMQRAGMAARFEGKEVMNDSWYSERLGEVRDHFLIAPTRVELEAVLEPLADDAIFFGYEFVVYPDNAGSRPEGAENYWRSYALRRAPYLDSDAIDDAELAFDPMTNQPQVMVHFTGAGADAFAQMTDRFAGYKLAIVLDGEIRSAPVIQERIPGGTAVVNMGYGAPDMLQARARDLVAVLRAGSLKSPMVLDSERVISRALSEGEEWTARALFALMIGLLVAAAAFGAQWLAVRFRR